MFPSDGRTRQHPIGRRDKPERGPGPQPQGHAGLVRCGAVGVRRCLRVTRHEHVAFTAGGAPAGCCLAVLPARFALRHGATPSGCSRACAGVASGLTGRHRRHVGINLDVHDELLRGSAILRLPCEMPGRGIGMRPPGGPLLGGSTDERRVGTPAPPALAGQYLAGGCRETAVAAQ